MGLEPQARHFPRRNRIVSGLARAVVVVEAAAKSGSLITARMALDQGREVMAVPGHPFDARASGCNMLIRDGATLVRGAEDVLAALGATATARPVPASGNAAAPASNGPGGAERAASGRQPGEGRAPEGDPCAAGAAILALLGPAPVSEDQLIRDLALPASQFAAELLALELDGQVVRHPGGLVSLAA
jgi:DNA processing protein